MIKNLTSVIGHLGADAFINEEKKFYSFNVAVATSNSTQWFEFIFFYKEELPGVANFLKKGASVYAEGTPFAKIIEKEGKQEAKLAYFLRYVELVGNKPKE